VQANRYGLPDSLGDACGDADAGAGRALLVVVGGCLRVLFYCSSSSFLGVEGATYTKNMRYSTYTLTLILAPCRWCTGRHGYVPRRCRSKPGSTILWLIAERQACFMLHTATHTRPRHTLIHLPPITVSPW
jgi:hypothetical protein